MGGLRLKIRQENLNPHSCRVWLNEMEISSGINALEVMWTEKAFTGAHLKITINELDVDTATIAQLQALVKMTDKEG